VTRDGELLAELGRGGYVGEGALLTDEPRGATVTAAGETVLLSLTRDSFSYLTEKYPAVRNHLQVAHRRRLTDGNLLVLGRRLIGRVPFLHGATDQLLGDLAAALVPQRCEAQEVVVAEGQTGELFFMIEKGAVRVSRAGETLANLGPGACFGEGVLLSTAPRAATAVALEDTRLLTLDRETFHTILQRHPDVRAAVLALHRSRNPFPLPAIPAAGVVNA
jgi:CRP-like cAMP-binding protein